MNPILFSNELYKLSPQIYPLILFIMLFGFVIEKEKTESKNEWLGKFI